MVNFVNVVVLLLCVVAVKGCDPRSGRLPPGSLPLYGRPAPPGSNGAYGAPGERLRCRRGAPIPRGPPGKVVERLCEPEGGSRGSPGLQQAPNSRGAPGPSRGLSIDRSSVRKQYLLSSRKYIETVFARLDLNGDNYVTLSEWLSEGGNAKNYLMFLRDIDYNGDGKIGFDEARRVAVSLR